MPTNVVKTAKDERLWKKAKKQAAKQGHTKDYAYIMGIYKKMKGESTTNGDMTQYDGHPPYSKRAHKKKKRAVENAVVVQVERMLQPGAGRKSRSTREMKKFLKKKGLLGIPRQRMK